MKLIKYKFLFIIIFILFSGVFFNSIWEYSLADFESNCHTVEVSDRVSSKYSSPVNFFSTIPKLMITATCDNNKNVQINVGNGDSIQYIYKYGYKRVNNKWKRIVFSGVKNVGSWIIGNASVVFSESESIKNGEILAYVCQKIEGKWKCGCGDKKCVKKKWQIQKYTLDTINNNSDKCKSDGVLDIHYPSAYISYPNKSIILHGSGFEKCPITEVLWNGKVKQTNLSSINGKELAIIVPDLKPGKYEVQLREDNKMSDYSTVIWIGKQNTEAVMIHPKITSISPEIGKQGDIFTIHGTGFTDNNDVITTFGTIVGLKSEDGINMSFKYNPFNEELKSYNSDTLERITYKIPVYATVMNTSGNSNVVIFNLEI